jgi:hypothetical protein
MLISQHFRHSTNCTPYFTERIMDMKTAHLQQFKRIMLPPKKRRRIPR